MSRITDNIERLVAERGMTKKDFFARLGITAAAFSQWRLEQSQPSLSKLYAAAEILGVDIADIVSGRNSMSFGDTPLLEMKKAAVGTDSGQSDKHKVLIDLFDSLSDDQQWSVIRQLQEIERLQKAQDALLGL